MEHAREEVVRALTAHILKSVTTFPDKYSTSELVSAVFTMAKLLIISVLETHNHELTRRSFLSSCNALEQEVWKNAPPIDKAGMN